MRIGAIVPFKTFNTNNPINSLSFRAKYSFGIKPDVSGDEFIRQQNELDKEARQAQKARKKGVNVPKYKITRTDNGKYIRQIRYETKGEIPDIENNPLRYKHLRKLFDNLYFMDRAGIFHNDLDKSHIFLEKDGGVEFDCFKYSVDFYKKRNGELKGNDGSIRTPEFMFPSNEDTFKEHFLGGYIDEMDEDDRYYFVKNYLTMRHNYHYRRGDLLVNRGFPLNSKTVQYEDIQAEVFLNPSNQVVNYEIKKLEAYGLKRKAFAEWDEGGGACGHEIKPKRRFNAILLNLDCIYEVMELRDEARILSNHAQTEAERKYFAFEEELAQKRLDDIYSDTKGMGLWNFNDTEHNIFLGTQEEKELFLLLFDDINTSDVLTAEKNLKIAEDYYQNLVNNWNKELNKQYKSKFENL